MRYLLIILTMALSGCANYKFGDGTKALLTVLEMHIAYCSSESEIERESLLEMIRLADPGYTGICDK